jgi:hypothetical protein
VSSRSLRSIATIGIAAATLATAQIGAWQTPPPVERQELSQQETELRVKAETARRLSVRPDEVRVIEASARVWPDAGLGCNARRGVLEPSPTRGFRIVAEATGRRLTFHTDRHGRLLRCITRAAPLDPIK